jgi:hypothetical protein
MARNRGAMDWTQKEDHYLLSNIARLTPRMIGEDLGRTQSAVESRVKTLRRKGVKIAYVPSGRRHVKGVDLDTNRLTTEPELTLSTERLVLRDEIASYLASLITSKRLTMDTATKAVEKIRTSILQASDDQFHRAASRRVADVVADFL